MKAFDLAKKFKLSSKMMIPRAVFMFLVFMTILVFGSSIFMGVGVSVFAVLAGGVNNALSAAVFFLAVEFLFCFCVFILYYGLFLSNLRFIRNQPVALSFLFAGFRQRRARKFAAFFIVPLVLAFIITMISGSPIAAAELPQSSEAQAFLDYFNAHPEFLRAVVLRTMFFCAAAFVLYFPFAFTWAFVYDGTKKSFKTLFAESLKFWKGRFLNFLGFEILLHYKKIIVIIICNVAEFFILQNHSESSVAQAFCSFLGFVCFVATLLLFATVILSINFYYEINVNPCDENENEESEIRQENECDENGEKVILLQENNENSDGENSN